ncbi:uncharacterized protein F4812DRAFT_409032 [Daldinia caldariorum]|uniref:uncharacterized protein n=1 Tax=Daldinia caldariorum TaxID=326644 RepID=UPI0020087537|nr:uncharacterized protein F4812DRAFT_409032 [Daldinia caldariorum]KAI1472477.1 hypothetical protein F4812DRAFT_409032 [Daldinia caldariorum]
MVASKAGPQPPKAPQQPTAGPEDQQQDEGEEGPLDRSIYQDGRGDFRGYYHDGAYIAYPPGYFDEAEAEDEDEDENEDEYYEEDYDGEEGGEEGGEQGDQELGYEDKSDSEWTEGRPYNSSSDEIRDAYFQSLTNQFLALREILQKDPPDHLLNTLPRSNPTDVGEFGPRTDTFAKWSGRLRGTDPLPAQIAGMRKESVLRLIRIILGGKFLRKNQELRERTSRWIWALLARLPDKGELDYQEIGWVRELGKRAVLLMVSLAEMEVLKEHYDVGDSTPESQGEVEVVEGVDEMSQGECCDYEDIDIDTNDPEPHHGGPGQPPGGQVPKLAPSGDTVGYGADLNSNGSKTDETVGTKLPPKDEVAEQSDVEMEMESEGEREEDGEVSDAPQQQTEPTADIERAKARLLEQLNNGSDAPVEVKVKVEEKEEEEQPPMTALEEEAFLALDAEEEEAKTEQLRRAKANERATLNMILTVAGEFYGQRDLLEFRDPFGGFQVE